FSCDPHLLEAILHAAERLGHELESRIVEETLLHTRHEAETRDLTDLAHFTEEPEIENELLIPPTTEVVEKLIDDQQEPLVRVLLLKRPHHLDEGILVVGHRIGAREGEAHPHLREVLLELTADDVAERHRDRADLNTDDLESPCDRLGLVHHGRV